MGRNRKMQCITIQNIHSLFIAIILFILFIRLIQRNVSPQKICCITLGWAKVTVDLLNIKVIYRCVHYKIILFYFYPYIPKSFKIDDFCWPYYYSFSVVKMITPKSKILSEFSPILDHQEYLWFVLSWSRDSFIRLIIPWNSS